MKIKLIAAALLLTAAAAFSTEIAYNGQPTNIQVVGNNSTDNRSRGFVMFTLKGVSDGNCKEFWMYPDEKGLLATLLSSKTIGVDLRVTAQSSALPPWGTPNACRVDQILIE